MSTSDNSIATISTPLGHRKIARLDSVAGVDSLPYSIKVLLESAVRNLGRPGFSSEDVSTIAGYSPANSSSNEIPFLPGRVILQDFTGVPAVVDLAAMRDAIVAMTGDPDSADKVNPLVPVDLVVDHSVQIDVFNRPDALLINSRREFERNQQRYQLLKWAQSAFNNFRVVPPATGIVHQVNLEYLAKVVWDDGEWLYPDSLVGTDSHTTMINGLGVAGWGVGGIEAEAVMVGQPIFMLLPEVVGVRLVGQLREGSTATDLVLRVTEMLRSHGVVGKFVEFEGPGLDAMPVATRATIANMAPEYGATVGFFPVDSQTIRYLELSGRSPELAETVEQYCRVQGLWRDDREISYHANLELDLDTVEPSLAGPRRPQDRIPLFRMKDQWHADLASVFDRSPNGANVAEQVRLNGDTFDLEDGRVVIAAITSCTNTSNPAVMVGAGLLARNARRRGLSRQPWVKTSLAPGSQVVTDYLDRAGLTEDLEALGFYLVGYGCTTCIGNSGPLPEPISEAINSADLVAASVLSGNRNFEGRISPHIQANYLASPPLVVAYALAGTVDWDPAAEPLGTDSEGREVYLRDIWPSQEEVTSIIDRHVSREQFNARYADVFTGAEEWRAVDMEESRLYQWSDESTYIQSPPFFNDLTAQPRPVEPIGGARALVMVGDSITTDHISPAGPISANTPAGRYLIERGVQPSGFNSYGARRGNDRIMSRGTFANIRVRNLLAPGTVGGFTTDFGDGQVKTIFEAAGNYQERGTPLIVIAGRDYGMGSSRDWAAKGPFLLGVRAAIAESYERIHRTNLVMMGLLPLQFAEGENPATLGLSGSETFHIPVDESLQPGQRVTVRAERENGAATEFEVIVRIDTPIEVDYYRHGGILPYVLRQMAGS
ncbi:MAG: aconitate hydratase AcnA [bacterium]|nr:aconitate hydratase AcnA [Acidimicrobiia bacterium]MCY4649980.1 aconitate hydratase AcnA [bacterium]